MDINHHFLEQLTGEYRARRARNPAYSLRSFGRDLGINSGRLSQYFSGHRRVTQKSALRIMTQLGISPMNQARWLGVSPSPLSDFAEPVLLEQKIFELISEPIHFTILSLMDTKGFLSSPRWIASRTRSSVPEVTQSLKLLVELGLAVRRGKTLVPTHQQGVRSSDGVKNAALVKAHENQLSQATEALTRIPLELRDVTSITVAADPAKLSEAKRLIKDFRRKLAKLLEGPNPTEVYRLQIQLFPLTEIAGELPNEG